jgi:hypothetical protein
MRMPDGMSSPVCFFQTRVAKKIVIAQQNPQHQTFTIAIEIKVE